MKRVRGIFTQSLETSKKMKRILLAVTAVYLASLLSGAYMVFVHAPFVMKLIEPLIKGLSENPVFSPILGALKGGNLGLAIMYTFLINLSSGAFASTTLPGVIPLIGAVGSLIVSGFRGFMIGAIFYYAEVFEVSPGYTVVGVGTLILELGAYVFSATAGINVSLSTIFPRRYRVDNRWTAFKEAWKDAGRIYVIVIILLALGAVWEMGGIYLFMR